MYLGGTPRPSESIIAPQNETHSGLNIGHMRQNIGQIEIRRTRRSDVLVKTYFERLYPHIRTELYYPSRKNSGIFVMRCFCAAGSNHFPFTKGKRYTSGDVPLPRKLYDGSRTMTPDIKASFHSFDEYGLTAFYKENIETAKMRDVMVAFGIPRLQNERGTVCAGRGRFSSGHFLSAIPMRLTILPLWSIRSSLRIRRKKRRKLIIRHRCYIREIRYISSRSSDRPTR